MTTDVTPSMRTTIINTPTTHLSQLHPILLTSNLVQVQQASHMHCNVVVHHATEVHAIVHQAVHWQRSTVAAG